MKLFINKKAYSAITASISMMFIFLTLIFCFSLLSPVFQNMMLNMEVDVFAETVSKNGGINETAENLFLQRLRDRGYTKSGDIEIKLSADGVPITGKVSLNDGNPANTCFAPCISINNTPSKIMDLSVTVRSKTGLIDQVASFFNPTFQNMNITVKKSILSIRE